MRRRLNFTRRRRISQSDVRIRLMRDDRASPMKFTAERNLENYDLPPDALVFLEAYRQNSYMRFPWGTVSESQGSGCGSTLHEIEGDTVFFRLKVVGADDDARVILAQADRIRVTVSTVRTILPVEVDELGEVVWRLSFDDDEPFLMVNSRIDNILDRARSDSQFASLVYPTVVREVLDRLCQEFSPSGDEQQEWVTNWARFVRTLTSEPIRCQPAVLPREDPIRPVVPLDPERRSSAPAAPGSAAG